MFLPKNFESWRAEEKWYPYWERLGSFAAAASSAKPFFSLCMPPPNITGKLHLGHALTTVLQDVLARFQRMNGYETLWVPSIDHAGIATQAVVERHFVTERSRDRDRCSERQLIRYAWQWKHEQEMHIVNQLRALGASCDWGRFFFTLDSCHNRTVDTAFKRLFDDGLIYEGDYLVNWDPLMQTTLSDEELEHHDYDTSLWHISYPLVGSEGSLMIATTRPETLPADVALAVSPEDNRHSRLIGHLARHPLNDRLLPIVGSDLVDPTFGTGAIKVTPAHDRRDYEIARQEQLPLLNILNPDGRLNEQATPYAHLTREEARQAILTTLADRERLHGQYPHRQRIARSMRSQAIVEPYLSRQWFLRLSSFREPLRAALDSGELRLYPRYWNKTYLHWVDNLEDWCISRQLFWGHRLPLWRRRSDPRVLLSHDSDSPPLAVATHPEDWTREPSVLDTWFSSALLPLSAFGWPEGGEHFDSFYPTKLLITGHDILFFWVVRMYALCKYLSGKAPFRDVFLHGLIYGKSYWRTGDRGQLIPVEGEMRSVLAKKRKLPEDISVRWEKMSKSRGNAFDPAEMIKRYGADGVRYALICKGNQSGEIALDEQSFVHGRHLANKMWNAARFVLRQVEHLDSNKLLLDLPLETMGLESRWIFSVFNRTIETVEQSLHSYSFEKALSAAEEFFWYQFCDRYLELSKDVAYFESQATQRRVVLLVIFTASLRILHPFLPFVSEELFQNLKATVPLSADRQSPSAYVREMSNALRCKACAEAPFPAARPHFDESVEKQFEFILEIAKKIRAMRTDLQIGKREKAFVHLIVKSNSAENLFLAEEYQLLSSLLPFSEIVTKREMPTGMVKEGKVGNVSLAIALDRQWLSKGNGKGSLASGERLSESGKRL